MTEKRVKGDSYSASTGVFEFLPSLSTVNSATDLKTVLGSLEEGVKSGDVPPIYGLMLLNGILNRNDVYNLVNAENRAIGFRLWEYLKSTGIQLDCPPIFEEKRM